jgi:hypothetical protein
MKQLRIDNPVLYKWLSILIINLILGAMTCSALVAAYWRWWPFDDMVVNYHNQVMTPTIRQGGTLIIRRSVRVNFDGAAVIHREVVQRNGIALYVLPTVHREYHIGEYTYDVYIPMPAELPAGQYLYIAGIGYKLNPLRDVSLPETTLAFNIK